MIDSIYLVRHASSYISKTLTDRWHQELRGRSGLPAYMRELAAFGNEMDKMASRASYSRQESTSYTWGHSTFRDPGDDEEPAKDSEEWPV